MFTGNVKSPFHVVGRGEFGMADIGTTVRSTIGPMSAPKIILALAIGFVILKIGRSIHKTESSLRRS